MAEYQELLAVIAAIRNATGDEKAWMTGLSTAELAIATNPLLSSEDRVHALITKIRDSHPDVFGSETAPRAGSAADAIRAAEAALARQNSQTAQLDLQMITAILNAHSVNEDGQRRLAGIQQEIESAVLSRTDLDTPTGARDFQRYLLGKLRDLRAVVDATGVDATSKATLSAALASLYVSAIPQDREPAIEPVPADEPSETKPADTELFMDSTCPELSDGGLMGADLSGNQPLSVPRDQPALGAAPPAAAAPPPTPTLPAFGGGSLPSGSALGAGLPGTPIDSLLSGASERPSVPEDIDELDELDESKPQTEAESEPPDELPQEEDPNSAVLSNGETVTTESPQIAAAITAAAQGIPIAQAFEQQGITIPNPGSPVPDPVDVAQLKPGDVGIFADRHALFIGNGKALFNNQIQPIDDLPKPGFLGWQRPIAAGDPAQAIPIRPSLTAAAPSG